MKKLSVILAGVVLFGGLSFAAPVLKQDAKAPVAKQNAKPAAKATKAPAAKTSKTATAPAKTIKKVPAKKAGPVKKTTK